MEECHFFFTFYISSLVYSSFHISHYFKYFRHFLSTKHTSNKASTKLGRDSNTAETAAHRHSTYLISNLIIIIILLLLMLFVRIACTKFIFLFGIINEANEQLHTKFKRKKKLIIKNIVTFDFDFGIRIIEKIKQRSRKSLIYLKQFMK